MGLGPTWRWRSTVAQADLATRVSESFARYADPSLSLRTPEPVLIRAGLAGGLPFDSLTSDLQLGCLPAKSICYGNCFAAKAAFEAGYDFGVRVDNIFDEAVLVRDLEALPTTQGYLRNGWNSDPSWNWDRAARLAELIRASGRLPIFITKCFRAPSRAAYARLAAAGAELRITVSAFATNSALRQRLEVALTLREHGGVAIPLLLSTRFRAADLNRKQQQLVETLVEHDLPAAENSLRISVDSPVFGALDAEVMRPLVSGEMWAGRLFPEQLRVPTTTSVPNDYRGLPSAWLSRIDPELLVALFRDPVRTHAEVLSQPPLAKPTMCGVALSWAPEVESSPSLPAEPRLQTRRGLIAISGRDVGSLIAGTLRGTWGYEQNFFAMVCERELEPPALAYAKDLLIALTAAQRPDDDLELTRLCASVGSTLIEAIRPALPLYQRLARASERLMTDAPLDVATAEQLGLIRRERSPLCERLHERARAHGHVSARLRQLEQLAAAVGGLVSVDGHLLAFLRELGVPTELAPFVKFVGRVPALTAVYRDELRQRPNRFVGVDERPSGTRPETEMLERLACAALDRNADFIDHALELMVGERREPTMVRASAAAIVAGAHYGKTAASSVITTLMACDRASAADTLAAFMSTFGFYHLGALAAAAEFQRAAVSLDTDGLERLIADELARERGSVRRRIAGFGHRFQLRDPRAVELLGMCRRLMPGRYIELAAHLDERLAGERIGHLNMDGISAAMALEVGFLPETSSALSLVARTPGVIRDYLDSLGAPRRALKVRSGLA